MRNQSSDEVKALIPMVMDGDRPRSFICQKGRTMTKKTKTIGERASALILAGMMVASTMQPVIALAADNNVSVGAQVGTGKTNLTMVTQANPNDEYSQTGDNIAFTVPSSINYVVAADGTLTGPTADATKITNGSNFPIHVSSAQVTAESGWSLVTAANYASSNADNAVKLSLGPSGGEIDIATYTSKTDISAAHAGDWSMAAMNGTVGLGSTGAVKNVQKDITTANKFAEIQWYVKSGAAVNA